METKGKELMKSPLDFFKVLKSSIRDVKTESQPIIDYLKDKYGFEKVRCQVKTRRFNLIIETYSWDDWRKDYSDTELRELWSEIKEDLGAKDLNFGRGYVKYSFW